MDIALLVIRVVFGLLIAGHGAQKLFGWFGGHGLKGTAGWLASLNLKPASLWAFAAGTSEFGGGLLMALGFLGPVGPLAIIAAMLMATLLVHTGKGVWATDGGFEAPLTNIGAAAAVLIAGPGRLSLDSALGVSLPATFGYLIAVATVVGLIAALLSRRPAASATQEA
jgi:putative oxidoreductase